MQWIGFVPEPGEVLTQYHQGLAASGGASAPEPPHAHWSGPELCRPSHDGSVMGVLPEGSVMYSPRARRARRHDTALLVDYHDTPLSVEDHDTPRSVEDHDTPLLVEDHDTPLSVEDHQYTPHCCFPAVLFNRTDTSC